MPYVPCEIPCYSVEGVLHVTHGDRPERLHRRQLYKLPQILLVDNPINRYLINSPMLPNLVRNPDGEITIYVQHTSPGPEEEANWLQTPAGDFQMVLRTYLPEQAVTDGLDPAEKSSRADPRGPRRALHRASRSPVHTCGTPTGLPFAILRQEVTPSCPDWPRSL